ncbi:hypothetical protein Tco_0074658 [Tanacetum coccineum]
MPAQSATQYWQPGTSSQHDSYYSFGRNIPNRGRREQFPSKYKLTPFTEQAPTTILPKQRVNKTKNKGKKANFSPLNLGGAFEDDNVEENNLTFLGSQFTGNFLMYENVDPSKVRRGNYVNLQDFLNEPHFSNPESSFAFRSNEYNTDDVVNEKPQNKIHKWQKFMSFEPDIPETPVYKAKPNISKQYSQ